MRKPWGVSSYDVKALIEDLKAANATLTDAVASLKKKTMYAQTVADVLEGLAGVIAALTSLAA